METEPALLESIWDAGGTDSIDWSNQTTSAFINLNDGEYSCLGPGYRVTRNDGSSYTEKRTLAIAYNTKIEHASGGTGDDRIIGNEYDDSIYGGQGDDDLEGNRGDDLLGGWSGDDILQGGAGNDCLYGDSGADGIFGDEGDDLIYGHTNNAGVIRELGTAISFVD